MRPTVQIAIRVDPELLQRLDSFATDDRRTRAGAVRVLLEQALSVHERTRADGRSPSRLEDTSP